MKILIIEDEKNIVLSLKILFKKLEYKAIFLSDDTDVIKISKETNPDLILLDIVLPNTDGYTICQALKNDNETSEIPVIFISALSSEKNIKKAYQVGAADYLLKPFNPDQIIKIIKKNFKGGIKNEKNTNR